MYSDALCTVNYLPSPPQLTCPTVSTTIHHDMYTQNHASMIMSVGSEVSVSDGMRGVHQVAEVGLVEEVDPKLPSLPHRPGREVTIHMTPFLLIA